MFLASTVAPCGRPTPSILASLFRQPSPRSPVPPSSFPASLQPVGARDVNGGVQRRVSRTDLDFEQALRAEGTVVLTESLDVDALGAYDPSTPSITSRSPYSSPSPSSPAPRTPHTGFQPATPTVHPPTPSPSGRTAAAVLGHLDPARNSTSSSAGRELYYDATEDSDLQTKRRSMYRSPGTASSPDLATLLRKSRKEAAGNRERSRDGRALVTPGSATQLTPNRLVSKDSPANRPGRQRSSTSSSNASPSSSSGNMTPSRSKQRAPPVPSLNVPARNTGSTEWVLSSPRSMSSMRDSLSSSKARTRPPSYL